MPLSQIFFLLQRILTEFLIRARQELPDSSRWFTECWCQRCSGSESWSQRFSLPVQIWISCLSHILPLLSTICWTLAEFKKAVHIYMEIYSFRFIVLIRNLIKIQLTQTHLVFTLRTFNPNWNQSAWNNYILGLHCWLAKIKYIDFYNVFLPYINSDF